MRSRQKRIEGGNILKLQNTDYINRLKKWDKELIAAELERNDQAQKVEAALQELDRLAARVRELKIQEEFELMKIAENNHQA